MPSSKLEKDLPMIEQHWNSFLSYVKQDLRNCRREHTDVVISLREIERTKKIVEYSKKDIRFLISHKESILKVANGLEQKIAILEAFYKRSNLDNAIALRTFQEVLGAEELQQVLDKTSFLKEKEGLLSESIERLHQLVNNELFNKSFILELCNKHKVPENVQISVLLYPIVKTLKKDPVLKKETAADKKNLPEEEIQSVVVIPTNGVKKEEISVVNFEEDYAQLKNHYEQFKDVTNPLLNQYYQILNEMKTTEFQYYKAFCSLPEEERQSALETNEDQVYKEAMSKILAIQIFDIKSELEELLQTIPHHDFLDKTEIELLEEYVREFESLCKKLAVVDKEIADIRKEILETDNSKVFFLTDADKKPFFPDIIQKKGYQTGFFNIVQKAQEGLLQNKQRANIMPLEIHDKEFREKCDRTVFSVRNNKVIVSYIKLHTENDLHNDGGIMILTACPINPNTIQENTEKVIRENAEKIVQEIELIEKGDPQEMDAQTLLRDILIVTAEDSIEEGGKNASNRTK